MAGRNGLKVNSTDTGWESRGGYMAAKAKKLEEQFENEAISRRQMSSLFYGISIYVTGWTIPSLDELKIIMSKHGGKFHMYYSRTKTSHVIASNLPHAKRKDLRPDQKVVKPEWITDCLQAKELLPIEKYLVVPLDNGTQNRITSLLGKRKSTDSESPCTSTSTVPFEKQNSTSIDDAPDYAQTTTEILQTDESKTLKTSSRTICPTTDSNFLTEFYSNSRLHFLSTWKMELTEYVRSLQSEESLAELPLSGYQKLIEIAKSEGQSSINHERVVMHIDMDCFFVSVGLKSRPELKGLPVAVTHTTGAGITSERPNIDPDYEKSFYEKKFGKSSAKTSDAISSNERHSSTASSYSEIASCSYEARNAGVKNGMFMGTAKKLCPDLRVIPYDFEEYRRTSDQLYSTVATFTRHIEAVSCDELLVDITKVVKETGLTPIKVATFIRNTVKEATGCNASTGVGPNIALARMATRHAKPDGEFAVTQEEAKVFMKTILVRDLPGVGRSTASRLQESGVANCGDLQNHSISVLKQEFGAKTGQKLHDMSCGIDNREVQIEKERKSVSAEVNYGIRLSTVEEAKTFFSNLSQEVTNRLKAISMRGRRITLKLMVRRADAPLESSKFGGHGVCDSWSRSSQINLKNSKGDTYEEDKLAIYDAAWSIYSSLQLKVSDLRGIGIQITQLQSITESSRTANSSSAAFLKKFIVKKSELQITEPVIASSSKDSAHTSKVIVNTTSTSDNLNNKNVDTLNSSFLDALPPDIRKEVQANFAQQKQALEINFANNENSNDSNEPIETVQEETGNLATNVLFCGRGKLSTGGKIPQNVTKGSKRKGVKAKTKSKTQRTMTSSRPVTRKIKNDETSPSKLITDMFPVTYSPMKSGSAKSSPFSKQINSPARVLAQQNSIAAILKVKRKLMSIREDEAIEISDSDDNEKSENIDCAKIEQSDASSLPLLGGAYAIEDIRIVLSEWIDAYADTGPLDCDIEDFISFLCKTASNTRDLEKVHLTLRSFRRRLISVIKQSDTKLNEWKDIYSKVKSRIQATLETSYRGGRLEILPL